MNLKIKIITGIALIAFFVTTTSVLTAGLIYYERSNEAKNTEESAFESLNNSKSDSNAQTTSTKLLSAPEIAKHNVTSDCWMIIEGNVYNLTSFLNEHPGGINIMTPYCGKDGTKAYQTKDKNPPSKHSKTADALLPKYLIGKLGEEINTDTNNADGNVTSQSGNESSVSVTPTPTPIPTAKSGTTLSSSEVAKHNTSSDCWLIISGKVYNVTNYLVEHPGGVSVITKYCGKESTNAFNTKDGDGSGHSSYANSLLAKYYIGNLGSTVSAGSSNTKASTNAITPTPTPSVTPTPTKNSNSTSVSLTTAEIATHNTSSNCWIIVSNKAYNVTNYLVSHPGGVSVITNFCGKEATNAFQTKGGKGKDHSTSAYNLLNNYLVGSVGNTVTLTPTPTATNTGSNSEGLPSAVSDKYPGATVIKLEEEDDGRLEIKLNYQGQCRSIKTSSSGSITKDEKC